MTEIKVYCDHCGKELDCMTDYTDITIEAAHKGVNADLCTDCFERLCEQISKFCKREGGAEETLGARVTQQAITLFCQYCGDKLTDDVKGGERYGTIYGFR